jgi:hypothetical protein
MLKPKRPGFDRFQLIKEAIDISNNADLLEKVISIICSLQFNMLHMITYLFRVENQKLRSTYKT